MQRLALWQKVKSSAPHLRCFKLEPSPVGTTFLTRSCRLAFSDSKFIAVSKQCASCSLDVTIHFPQVPLSCLAVVPVTFLDKSCSENLHKAKPVWNLISLPWPSLSSTRALRNFWISVGDGREIRFGLHFNADPANSCFLQPPGTQMQLFFFFNGAFLNLGVQFSNQKMCTKIT